MTPEFQRIAIAEACGWKQEPSPFSDKLLWITPKGLTAGGVKDALTGLPDYINDLNAMHEAEKVHWSNQVFRQLYRGYLLGLTNDRLGQAYDPTGDEWSNTIHATASQRAEAFLKCLGKWVD